MLNCLSQESPAGIILLVNDSFFPLSRQDAECNGQTNPRPPHSPCRFWVKDRILKTKDNWRWKRNQQIKPITIELTKKSIIVDVRENTGQTQFIPVSLVKGAQRNFVKKSSKEKSEMGFSVKTSKVSWCFLCSWQPAAGLWSRKALLSCLMPNVITYWSLSGT